MDAKKKQKIITIVLVGLFLTAVVIAGFFAVKPWLEPHVALRAGDGIFRAKLAQTEAEHVKGLSGVREMSQESALLFVYEDSQERSIWMKDMHISIDVVWLDESKRVIHIAKNLSPDTYPRSFSANKPARYIVELPAGTTERKAITVGMVVSFDLNQIQGVSW